MRSLLAPRWLLRHAVALVLVGLCVLLMVWQWRRATGGNTLSWAYVAEWPLFAAFVAWMWLRAVRDDLSRARGEDPYAATRLPPLRPREPAATRAGREADLAGGAAPDLAGERRAGRPPAAPADDDDPQLAEYNRYLAWLAANPGRKLSDYQREATTSENRVDEGSC